MVQNFLKRFSGKTEETATKKTEPDIKPPHPKATHRSGLGAHAEIPTKASERPSAQKFRTFPVSNLNNRKLSAFVWSKNFPNKKNSKNPDSLLWVLSLRNLIKKNSSPLGKSRGANDALSPKPLDPRRWEETAPACGGRGPEDLVPGGIPPHGKLSAVKSASTGGRPTTPPPLSLNSGPGSCGGQGPNGDRRWTGPAR